MEADPPIAVFHEYFPMERCGGEPIITWPYTSKLYVRIRGNVIGNFESKLFQVYAYRERAY